MQHEYDYLVVGAGLFGAVFAREARRAGRRCLVVDKREHTGGNLHCDEVNGIHVHRYGAHIFHTDNRDVWQYVNALVDFNRYTNSPIARWGDEVYNLPFNMNTFRQLWGVTTPDEARAVIDRQRARYAHITEPRNLEEQALKLCGDDIYQRLIKGYTEKQWGRSAEDLPAFIIRRIPLRFTYDNNYFNDRYQGIPCGGYNPLVDALLDGIEVRTGIDFLDQRDRLSRMADKVLFTGCIDAYYGERFGRLEYRSLRFETRQPDTDNFQGCAVVNYTDREVPYTRIIEHKHFDGGTQAGTVITYEYPDACDAPGKEPYYPVNDERNNATYRRYRALAEAETHVLFGGRLADYAYYDMDDTVEAALRLCDKELRSSGSHNAV